MGAQKLEYSLYSNVQLQSEYYRNLPQRNFVEFGVIYINLKKKGKYFSMFRNLLEHFVEYQDYIGRSYSTKEIGKEEVEGFVEYLHIEKMLKISTIKGMITRFKYLLEKAYLNGWAVDDSYSDARVRESESTQIYLKDKEIARIYYAEGLTKKQEEVKDMFVLGCMTGQRYSDYSRLTKDNVIGDNIHVMQQKTKTKAVIPLTDYVREIFTKYEGKLPKPRCIQYFNKAIKIICKKIGLTETIVYEEEIAGDIVMTKKPKYEMICSHTARRTFVTNMIKNNVERNKIMKCTGHKSSVSFDGYDRMTLIDNARSLAGNGYLS